MSQCMYSGWNSACPIVPGSLNAVCLWHGDKQDWCSHSVTCGQIVHHIHNSILKATQKYTKEGVWSSLEEPRKGGGCSFTRKNLVNWYHKEEITKEGVLGTGSILSKWKVEACGPERGEASRWDWRNSHVRFYVRERRTGKRVSPGELEPF